MQGQGTLFQGLLEKTACFWVLFAVHGDGAGENERRWSTQKQGEICEERAWVTPSKRVAFGKIPFTKPVSLSLKPMLISIHFAIETASPTA
jgi:leucyl aminopeptidase (aminopeptidase T)